VYVKTVCPHEKFPNKRMAAKERILMELKKEFNFIETKCLETFMFLV